jgi:hypothetical protein
MNIRFQQGKPNFTHCRINIRFGKFSSAAQLLKYVV